MAAGLPLEILAHFSVITLDVRGTGGSVPIDCVSGQTSGEQCGETVQSVDAQVCTQTGCKSPVISYTGPVSQPGDSGAPVTVNNQLNVPVMRAANSPSAARSAG